MDTAADDGRRYALTGPRGVDAFLDNLNPHAGHHTITVYGSTDLPNHRALLVRRGMPVALVRTPIGWKRRDVKQANADRPAAGRRPLRSRLPWWPRRARAQAATPAPQPEAGTPPKLRVVA